MHEHRQAEADALVIFGITGDLAKKMTLRSLYRLERRGLLGCPIVGVAVEDWTVEHLREHAREAIEGAEETLDDEVFERFAARLSYVSGDFTSDETYKRLASPLGDGDGETRAVYLETPPPPRPPAGRRRRRAPRVLSGDAALAVRHGRQGPAHGGPAHTRASGRGEALRARPGLGARIVGRTARVPRRAPARSEEHTSELQSLR